MVTEWQAYLDQNRERFLSEFLDLLRIPSVSTLPEARADVRRAAEWVADRLRQAGIEHVRLLETGGHPVVYGDWLHAPGKPTLLIYGHYDVQPVDPLELWSSPPFEPAVRDRRIYARGASDMKGNLLLPIIACEALLRTAGALPVGVRFLIEGEEEIGSPSLAACITAHRELLACDMVVNADAGQFSEEQPEIAVALRGLAGVQIDVRTASTDLHSGLRGGMVPNAIHALTQILAALRSPDGRITVEGFYDNVIPLTDADRAMMARVPSEDARIQAETGIKAFFGEPGYTPRERNWGRPTLDVNGIWGGFQGDGIKTVIPCEAHAKITCRLVANQTPEEIIEKLQAHILKHAPAYADVSVQPLPGRAMPYLLPADHPGLAAAQRVLTELYGREPYIVRGGATVPATAVLRELLGVYAVPLGFSLPDEKIHAPGEFVRITSFERGQRAYCRFLQEMGR